MCPRRAAPSRAARSTARERRGQRDRRLAPWRHGVRELRARALQLRERREAARRSPGSSIASARTASMVINTTIGPCSRSAGVWSAGPAAGRGASRHHGEAATPAGSAGSLPAPGDVQTVRASTHAEIAQGSRKSSSRTVVGGGTVSPRTPAIATPAPAKRAVRGRRPLHERLHERRSALRRRASQRSMRSRRGARGNRRAG